MSAIRYLWAQHRTVLLMFLAGTLVTLFFLVRLTVFTLYWSDPAHRDRSPEAWMTPGYVAHSWGLDPQELGARLGVAPGTRPTLDDIARARGVPVAQVIADLTALLEESRDQ